MRHQISMNSANPNLVKLALALGLVVIGACGFHAPAQATPQITITADSANFGLVPIRTTVTHRYWIHSTGSSALEVEWTDASCPCAQLPLTAKTIEPGDSVAFELLLQPGRQLGTMERRPYIKTNASSEPTRVWFSGTSVRDMKVTTPLGFSPFRADLSQFGENRQDTARLKFTNNSDAPLIRFEIISTRDEHFSVQFPELVAPGESGECVVILNSKASESAFESSFTFNVISRPIGADNIITRYSVPVRRKFSGK